MLVCTEPALACTSWASSSTENWEHGLLARSVSRTTGCCRKPRSKRVEPDGDAATDGAKGGATKDEEEGDDDESEEESSED